MFTPGVNYTSIKSKTWFGASGEAQGAAGCWLWGALGCSSSPSLPGKVSRAAVSAPGAGLGFHSCPSLTKGRSQGCPKVLGFPGSLPWDQEFSGNGTAAPSRSHQGDAALIGAPDTSLLRGPTGEKVQYFNFCRQKKATGAMELRISRGIPFKLCDWC